MNHTITIQTKAGYIKRTTQICATKYEGDIPSTLEDLLTLPGIGYKMANLVMLVAYKQLTGIAVDTHVHRIANRLGWVTTKTPDKTRKPLEELIPRSYWDIINHTLVGFGQQVCAAKSPKCKYCLNRFICPSSKAKVPDK